MSDYFFNKETGHSPKETAVSFGTLLTMIPTQIVFLILKFISVITWSWWIVFIPLYVLIIILSILFIVIAKEGK